MAYELLPGVSVETSQYPRLEGTWRKLRCTARSPSSDDDVEDVDMGEYARPGVESDGDNASPAKSDACNAGAASADGAVDRGKSSISGSATSVASIAGPMAWS